MQVNFAALHSPITTGGKGKVSIILIELVSLTGSFLKLTFEYRNPLEMKCLLLHWRQKLGFCRQSWRGVISSPPIYTCAETSFLLQLNCCEKGQGVTNRKPLCVCACKCVCANPPARLPTRSWVSVGFISPSIFPTMCLSKHCNTRPGSLVPF